MKRMKFFLLSFVFLPFFGCQVEDDLVKTFQNPPEGAKPGVYWYFMDGNLSREEMTKDLESMKAVGINHVIFLEVGIGVPRGPVDFMSEGWQELFVHAVRETERLGMRILLGAGPGWCGSGGPWVTPEQSMQHLVFSETEVSGGQRIQTVLPVPKQRSTIWHNYQDDFYQDQYVFAIPRQTEPLIGAINEKALYERDPYSSKPHVKPHLPALAEYPETDPELIIQADQLIDLRLRMDSSGQIDWEAPPGEWTIVRMGLRVTGASTRPSPLPVIGLECNKMNREDFASHLKNYTDILLEKSGPVNGETGWTGFHIDSWESGAQNWTRGIVKEFVNRRGYDPEPYLITFTGRAYQSVELTERFLWDWRKTCQELVLENHMAFALEYAHANGLELTVEPYDMNPAGDLDLGSYADVIMAEFWSNTFGFPTAYAVLQATSISHLSGKPVVGAEVFTANGSEAYQQYPGSMKDQSDWALAMGINRFVYHTFAHKPLGDTVRPGMSMGSIGIHWDRGQTWWPLVDDYHTYISRASHLMQQGQAVSDILYLTPEGAPMIFTPPADALFDNGDIPDKKGYGFDGCSPIQLMERTEVVNGRIVFPGASSYAVLVIPSMRTMTPELLNKIASLVDAGARVIGLPPLKSPSLTNFPQCDDELIQLATRMWGSLDPPNTIVQQPYGQGLCIWGGDLNVAYSDSTLYPGYVATTKVLKNLGIDPDFRSEQDDVRYGHRKDDQRDYYFVSNRTGQSLKTVCEFRALGKPEIWIPETGETRPLKNYRSEGNQTIIPLEFYPHEGYFIVFSGKKSNGDPEADNFPKAEVILEISGSWDVEFNPTYGGPAQVTFPQLIDWTDHPLDGIKYYSGIAKYRKTFTFQNKLAIRYYLDLGQVHDLARVIVNGVDLGVVWTDPWRLDLTDALHEGENQLEIQVANRWINRILGDRLDESYSGTIQFSNGLLEGKTYPRGRYTFTLPGSLWGFVFTEPFPSGLIGPVTITGVK